MPAPRSPGATRMSQGTATSSPAAALGDMRTGSLPVPSGTLPALAASGQNGQMAVDRHAGAGPAALPGWAREITRLTVLTGAGISTDSGIPDFRGPSGIWTKNPAAEKLSTYQAYMADPELRRRSWQNRLAHPAWAAEPNPAHLALARLARSTIDTQVLTQNIDGLHQRAGTPLGRISDASATADRGIFVVAQQDLHAAFAQEFVRDF